MAELAALADIIGIFAGLVDIGSSVAGASSTGGYMITVGIQVDNLTDSALMDANVSLESGEVEQPPVKIAAGYKEAMLARKHDMTATGSHGVVSWRIGETANRLVIMWHVPYDYNFYSNWLAVGIHTNAAHDPTWATEMYDAEGDHGTWYEKAKYDTQVPTVTWIEKSLGMAVSATMSTVHHAQVLVTFAPTRKSGVAKSLLEKKDAEKSKLNKK